MNFQWILAPASNTHTGRAPHFLEFPFSTPATHQDTLFYLCHYLLFLYYLYLSYLFSKMQVKFFQEDLSVLNDDETVKAGNQLFSTTLCLVLQIKASKDSIIDSKLANAKTTLESTLGTTAFFLPLDTHPTKYETVKRVKAVPSKEKLKFLKGYKVFSERIFRDTFSSLLQKNDMSKDYFDNFCQESLNDFTSSAARGWITNFRLASCISKLLNHASFAFSSMFLKNMRSLISSFNCSRRLPAIPLLA